MKKLVFILLFLTTMVQSYEDFQWINIGSATYEQGFLFPYKIDLAVPYGVRDVDDIKKGLIPMRITLDWLPVALEQKKVAEIFNQQLKDNYKNEENFKLSKNLIYFFLKKLPAISRHDSWVFTYLPDEGTKLHIDEKKIHHLVGAELNRALIQSWVNKNPVITSKLFNRLLQLQ